MQEITRVALDTYDGLVRSYRGRLETDLLLGWDSDTLVMGDGGVSMGWLFDPANPERQMPEEARIALINYDRLVRLRGRVALPDNQEVTTYGPDEMILDLEGKRLIMTTLGAPQTLPIDVLCSRWPGVLY